MVIWQIRSAIFEYIPMKKEIQTKTNKLQPVKEKKIRINFEVTEDLRNAFKAKTASQGKNVKDVLITFMQEYIKK